jgi:hypothetical protein
VYHGLDCLHKVQDFLYDREYFPYDGEDFLNIYGLDFSVLQERRSVLRVRLSVLRVRLCIL